MPDRSRLTFVAWCLGAAVLAAQSDRIAIRLVPKPESTIHYQFAQELSIDVSPDASVSGGLAIPPITTMLKVDLACTQVNGSRDAQGQMESRMTYDQMNVSVTLNGQPMPGGAPASQLVGRQVTMKYDDQGNVVDVQMPADMPAPAEQMKGLIMAFSNALPPVTLAIGESTSVPLNLALPMPLPGGSASPSLQGQTVLKLLSIDRDGAAPENAADRIARFESTIDVSLDNSDTAAAPPGPLLGVKLEFRVNGKGTMDANLDGGFIKTSQMNGTLDGAVSPGSSGVSLPPMKFAGTLKITMTGTY